MPKATFPAPLFVAASALLIVSTSSARNVDSSFSISELQSAKIADDTRKCAGRYALRIGSESNVYDISIITFKGEFRSVIHTLVNKKNISKVTRVHAKLGGCAIDIESETGRGTSADHLKFELTTKDTLVFGRAIHELPDGGIDANAVKGAYMPDGSPDGAQDDVAKGIRAVERARANTSTQYASNTAPTADNDPDEQEEHPAREPARLPLTRRQGRIKFAVTSVLVAPGKDSGAPWDLWKPLPDEVSSGLKNPLSAELGRELFKALGMGSHFNLLNSVLPWTKSAFVQNKQAPDVQVDLYVGETRVLTTSKVADSYSPTWPNAYTPALEIRDDTQISIDATDIDVNNHDHIGTCTLKGVPPVDAHSYAQGQAFKCLGQLWAVSLRVVAADDE